jgi:haloalkane dehalogenase
MHGEKTVAILHDDRSVARDADVEVRPAWITDAIFPFRSRFIAIGDARLHYIDEGTGPTLLFLHGSPMWSFMFRHSIAALRDRFRCVAVDMPGLGLSTAPIVEGKAFESNAGYYRDFVRRLDLRDIVVIAHATAGPSALRIALDERERIAGLVITNSFAWPMNSFPSMWRFVRIVSSPPFRMMVVGANLLARLTTRIGKSAGSFTDEERAAIMGPYYTMNARWHLANLLYGLKAEVPFFARVEADVGALKHVPTLLLSGAKDHGYQAGFVTRWQQLLPESSVVVLENSAHFAPEDEPEAYTAALANWLEPFRASRPAREHLG